MKELRVAFLPADYDKKVTEKLWRKSQGKDELVDIYVAVMRDIFVRLTDPYT